jgi:hypothetical protein
MKNYLRTSLRFRSSFHDLGLFENGRVRTKVRMLKGIRAKITNRSFGKSERGIFPKPGFGSLPTVIDLFVIAAELLLSAPRQSSGSPSFQPVKRNRGDEAFVLSSLKFYYQRTCQKKDLVQRKVCLLENLRYSCQCWSFVGVGRRLGSGEVPSRTSDLNT